MFICCFCTFPVTKYIRNKQLQKLHTLKAQGASEKTKHYEMGWKSLFSFSCLLFYFIAVMSIFVVDLGIQFIAQIEPFSWFVFLFFILS